jgi:hypothetical protein
VAHNATWTVRRDVDILREEALSRQADVEVWEAVLGCRSLIEQYCPAFRIPAGRAFSDEHDTTHSGR